MEPQSLQFGDESPRLYFVLSALPAVQLETDTRFELHARGQDTSIRTAGDAADERILDLRDKQKPVRVAHSASNHECLCLPAGLDGVHPVRHN